ncbi:MAG: hypothetical protein U5L11_08285 [Arhodomonas sp.]|nr:hypothetical protein [Arhodomonas sp.]
MPTDYGQVPIGNFVELRPGPSTGTIERVDGRRVFTIRADAAEGRLVDNQVQRAASTALAEAELPRRRRDHLQGRGRGPARGARTFPTAAFIVAVLPHGRSSW